MTHYELGSRAINKHIYRAVPVDNYGALNGVGAYTTGGKGFIYGWSVDEGVAELLAYMNETTTACPATRYILGGYSQGAQVIGQALSKMSDFQRSRVVFVGLFGDPKLYLPEGKGIIAPACLGRDYSPWRRTIGDCNTDRGILGARIDYLPKDLQNVTGLWCNSHDAICGGSPYIWDMDGHGWYKNDDGAISSAAFEAIERLKKILMSQTGSTPTPPASGATRKGLDLAIVMDTTGSMYGQIDAAKALASSIAEKTIAANGRIALVEYRDGGDYFTAEVRQHLTTNRASFEAAVGLLVSDGGGDVPEAALHALLTTFNTLDWKPGAEKAAIVITDAPYHDPDRVDGTTTAQVIKRSLEIDPVNVYVILPNDYAAGNYAELVEGTAGKIIIDSDPATAIMEALTSVLTRPTVVLPQAEYSGRPGDEFHFDASQSYIEDATITSYDWDFDGDGAFDQTTANGVVDHAYPAPFSGIMHVRVKASNGTVASQTALVEVSQVRNVPVPPEAPAHVEIEPLADGNVRLTWSAPVLSTATQWGVAVNDVLIGLAPQDRFETIVTDTDRNRDTTFGVMAIDAEGLYSEIKSVLLPATNQGVATIANNTSSTKPNTLLAVATEPGATQATTTGMELEATPSSAESTSSKPRMQTKSESARREQARDNRLWLIGVIGLATVGGGAWIWWRQSTKR